MLAVGSRAEVFHGKAKHTSGGLVKKDLKKSKKTEEIVSKKKSKEEKDNSWASATKKAYAEMKKAGIITASDGLIKMNIGTKGKQLYDLASQYHSKL
jgi:hypothetical protein